MIRFCFLISVSEQVKPNSEINSLYATQKDHSAEWSLSSVSTYNYSAALTFATRFSTVKPYFSIITSPGAEAPKVVMPRTFFSVPV